MRALLRGRGFGMAMGAKHKHPYVIGLERIGDMWQLCKTILLLST